MTTITLGVPMYNEEEFVDLSVQNALDVGHDHVVYLDDGSKDGTLEKLKEYAEKYPHIHVYSNRKNSVNNVQENRWYTLAKLCKQYDTDWIMVRAADEAFSYAAFEDGPNLLKQTLAYLLDKVHTISFPRIELWRSDLMYRVDSSWKMSSRNQLNISCWNNRRDWEFTGTFKVSGFHAGAHRPNLYDGKIEHINAEFNPVEQDPFNLVILHYGLATHKRIADKLEYQLKTVNKLGGGTGIMTTKEVPSVKEWNRINGYKIAHEFYLKLKPVHQGWYRDPLPEIITYPEVESLYNVIKKFNKERAKEYKILFEGVFGK